MFKKKESKYASEIRELEKEIADIKKRKEEMIKEFEMRNQELKRLI